MGCRGRFTSFLSHVQVEVLVKEGSLSRRRLGIFWTKKSGLILANEERTVEREICSRDYRSGRKVGEAGQGDLRRGSMTAAGSYFRPVSTPIRKPIPSPMPMAS